MPSQPAGAKIAGRNSSCRIRYRNRILIGGATVDTSRFAETLQEAGIPETQAKAISNAVRNACETAELVSKADLREAVSEVRAEMQTLGNGMRSDIQRLDFKIDRLELQLTVRLGGLVVVALGAFTALSKWIA